MLAFQAAFRSCSANTSGRSRRRYIRRAFGIPSLRHSDTACGVTSHMTATAPVPPRSSMILFVSIPHSSTLDVCESSPLYIFSVSVADMNTLTERIKEAVQEAIKKGHTVLSLATACGCKDKSVYQWLKGEPAVRSGRHLPDRGRHPVKTTSAHSTNQKILKLRNR